MRLAGVFFPSPWRPPCQLQLKTPQPGAPRCPPPSGRREMDVHAAQMPHLALPVGRRLKPAHRPRARGFAQCPHPIGQNGVFAAMASQPCRAAARGRPTCRPTSALRDLDGKIGPPGPFAVTRRMCTFFFGQRQRSPCLIKLVSFCRETAIRRRSNPSLTVGALMVSLKLRDFESEPRPLGSVLTRGNRVSRQKLVSRDRAHRSAIRWTPRPGRLGDGEPSTSKCGHLANAYSGKDGRSVHPLAEFLPQKAIDDPLNRWSATRGPWAPLQ